MTEAVAGGREAGGSWKPRNAWQLTCGAFVFASVLLFAYAGLRYTNETQHELRLLPYLRFDHRVDFAYFFSGANMAWHGDAAELYPEPGEWTFYPDDPPFLIPNDEYTNVRLLGRGNYYNPPALAFLEAPLTTLSFKGFVWVFTAASLTCLAGVIGLAWWKGRGISELPLLLLGVAAFKPLQEALIMGHMTLVFALVLTGGFLLLRAEKRVLAGLTFSVLALKPQWAILPGLFLVVRGEWKALASMAVAASLIFLVPFFVTGLHTLSDYLQFLRFQSRLDIKDAPHMFSWNGFLFKLRGGPLYEGDPFTYDWNLLLFHIRFGPFDGSALPSPALVYALVALTVAPLAIVWASRDYFLGVAATVLAMLLISTHSVWYDWALLAVVAVFLVLRLPQMSRGRRVELWVVLLTLFVTASQSVAVLLAPDRHFIDWHHPGFYTLTLAAFGALVWMAWVALRDVGLSLPRWPARAVAE